MPNNFEDFDLDWGWIMKQVERRQDLCKHPPLCPECLADQIQIINSYDKPASWKCRICKWKFTYEPT